MSDEFICNNFHFPDIDQVLNEFDDISKQIRISNNIHQEGKHQQSLDESVDG